ncbi:MAG: DUF4160 domain-containing protein [Mollicutes bacterium UO1]
MEFYPAEFIQAPHKEIHIHVLTEKGSMKVRLEPVERDKKQFTNIPLAEQRKIIDFVKEHLEDIKQRIKEELASRKIKINILW